MHYERETATFWLDDETSERRERGVVTIGSSEDPGPSMYDIKRFVYGHTGIVLSDNQIFTEYAGCGTHEVQIWFWISE